MKKRILCILLACLLILPLFSGCHGARGMDAFVLPEQLDESREFEVVFWAKNDTNKTQTTIYENAIRAFEAIYPNIHIKLRLYTDYGKIYNDVITNIATGTTPNVCITYPDHIATYMTGENVVVPLDELLTDPVYGLGGSEVRFDAPTKDEIIPEFLSECRIGEHTYALPFMRSTEALYVNKTYVEALGYTLPDVVTWDFIWEVSEKAMEKDEDGNFKINGQKVLIPFIYKSTDNMMIQMLRQETAPYSTEDGEILIFSDETADILRTVSEHARSRAFSTFKISSYPANLLNAGQCIFAVDSTAGATWMGTHAPLSDISPDKLVEFETAVRPVPQFDPEDPKMISQGPSVCIFNKRDPQEVLAAWLFTQYLLSNDVQIAYSETEGYIPVTSKAHKDERYVDYITREGDDDPLYYEVKLEASRLLLENTDKTFTTPVFNGSTSLRDAAGALIEETVKAERRGKTVDDAFIEKIYSDVSALYRLGQANAGEAGKRDLGPLPNTATALLCVLAGVWVLIIVYVGLDALHKKRRGKA